MIKESPNEAMKFVVLKDAKGNIVHSPKKSSIENLKSILNKEQKLGKKY